MNKGEMMKLVYTEQELQNIDSAIPKEFWNKIDTAVHVMNFNSPFGCFGKLQNMETEACSRGIDLKLQQEEELEEAFGKEFMESKDKGTLKQY